LATKNTRQRGFQYNLETSGIVKMIVEVTLVNA